MAKHRPITVPVIIADLTDETVRAHIATNAPARLYDLSTPGLSLRGPNKLGQHVWWYESAKRGTPAMGALHNIDLEAARSKASDFGPPSLKAVKIIGRGPTPSTRPTYEPDAKRLEAMNALVAEMIEARWQVMRPKIASFIRDEIAKAMRESAR
jgi:hypothetical protein